MCIWQLVDGDQPTRVIKLTPQKNAAKIKLLLRASVTCFCGGPGQYPNRRLKRDGLCRSFLGQPTHEREYYDCNWNQRICIAHA
jgi:hypothetical protein